jgi:hypothetical protein
MMRLSGQNQQGRSPEEAGQGTDLSEFHVHKLQFPVSNEP